MKSLAFHEGVSSAISDATSYPSSVQVVYRSYRRSTHSTNRASLLPLLHHSNSDKTIELTGHRLNSSVQVVFGSSAVLFYQPFLLINYIA